MSMLQCRVTLISTGGDIIWPALERGQSGGRCCSVLSCDGRREEHITVQRVAFAHAYKLHVISVPSAVETDAWALFSLYVCGAQNASRQRGVYRADEELLVHA